MDFTNIMAKLGTIDDLAMDLAQLRREIEGLQLMVVEMKLAQENAAGLEIPQLDLAEQSSGFAKDDDLRRRIEDLVSTRISNWKYAQQGEDGAWRCPLTASAVAEALGHSSMWREVARLMRSPGWERLSWYKAPPPSNWRGGDRDAKWIQWVMVRGAS